MKQQSISFKKAVLGVLATVVSMPALACNLISFEALQNRRLSEQDIEVLLNEKILLKTDVSNQFFIDHDRMDEIIQSSQDQELQNFSKWLRSVVDSNANVSNPSCDEMVLSTQDGIPIVR